VAGFADGLQMHVPWYSAFVRYFASHWDEQQRVAVLGFRDIASNNSTIRCLASRATMYVRVHVQHDGSGGGGVSYNASTFSSSTQVDTRENKQYDGTIARDGTNRFFVWLIPEFLNNDGSFTKFNGADGADHMAYIDLGT
jgi:hypothetical protein